MDEVDVGVEMEVPMLWGGPCLRWCFGFSCGLAGHYGSEVFLLCSLLGFAVVLMVRLLKVHQLSSSLQQWYLMVVEFQLTFMFESFSSSWLVEDSGEAFVSFKNVNKVRSLRVGPRKWTSISLIVNAELLYPDMRSMT
ncbi:hypothetical protein M9H77_02700 [Catharanthus roseus]|uniref:Uncharacterized protein n=1 Tax=Catharanthus roseus TaxID=4058 RepID=A0ACC0C948_CATRO|nr:hypothetical protein M9H77_02700 [Catharanthus roseus]